MSRSFRSSSPLRLTLHRILESLNLLSILLSVRSVTHIPTQISGQSCGCDPWINDNFKNFPVKKFLLKSYDGNSEIHVFYYAYHFKLIVLQTRRLPMGKGSPETYNYIAIDIYFEKEKSQIAFQTTEKEIKLDMHSPCGNFPTVKTRNLGGILCIFNLANAISFHRNEIGKKDDKASLVFDPGDSENNIVEEDVVSWTWLFTDCAHNGSHVDVPRLFRETRVVDLGGDGFLKKDDRTIMTLDPGGWNLDQLILIANS
ncbi:hypothetical protein HAX54_005915 [Datura stramonium]|uniref:Uncharacterized protein n=1 Tax=Datura stramonium TaxID=4076 RepID=A0ABS8T9L5_DATST|nr:hypothetical protein [Datura stramonium]